MFKYWVQFDVVDDLDALVERDASLVFGLNKSHVDNFKSIMRFYLEKKLREYETPVKYQIRSVTFLGEV